MSVAFSLEVRVLPLIWDCFNFDEGGISFASTARGFGANNVLNYEVVLANGTIVEANEETNADLYWALKLAGTNYGLVTRFDLDAYPSPLIWGNLNVYAATQETVFEILTDFGGHIRDTMTPQDHKIVMLSHTSNMSLAVSAQANNDGVPLDPVTTSVPLMHSERYGATYEVVDEVMSIALQSTALTAWYTFTTEVDANLYWDIYQEAKRVFGSLFERDEGLTFTMSLMALPRSFIEKSAGSPIYNALKRSRDDLISQCFFSLFLP